MAEKDAIQDHRIEDLEAEIKKIQSRQTWVIGLLVPAILSFFIWYDGNIRKEFRHHEDHPQYHANGFSRVVDNFVSKDHFDSVVEQLNKRIEELQDGS